ncbi:MAG: hypothetical protein EXS37_16950 [Opitutus sp.]|nr:hypothetical protein [Opitutus sp.]
MRLDEYAFGDLKSFREQFATLSQEQVFQTLKARLKPICHRTLRRQVTAYISYTNRFERPLIQLSRHELRGHADFQDNSSFELRSCPFPGDIPLGRYELPRRSGDTDLYRLNHPQAEAILVQARSRELPLQERQFGYADHDGRISVLKSFLCRAGWLVLSAFTVEALDQSEDNLLFEAQDKVDQRREELIASIEGKLTQRTDLKTLFTIRWKLV